MQGRRISVVVPTRNRGALLCRLLEALDRQTLPSDEVVVVDDASDDDTPEIGGAWVRDGHVYLRQLTRSGSYAARNRGWRRAAGSIIAFTDDDCVPAPGWIEAIERAFADPRIGVVQGATWAEPGDVTPFTHQIDQRSPGPPYRTCNIAYRRDVLESLGGFREDLLWYADNILGLRARRVTRFGWAPDAVVCHPPRPREWRDTATWLARFEADRAHRRELHRLGAETALIPSGALPVVLWVLRPLAKQGLFHLTFALRHPGRYLQGLRPMLADKRALFEALRERRAHAGEALQPQDVTGAHGDATGAPAGMRDGHPVLGPLPPNPLVSAVVVTRGRHELLQGALSRLSEQTYGHRETIVVDNEASPTTRMMAERAGARYVPADGLTLGAARQAGVDAAGGEVVAFTDDDCLPDPDWLMSLVAPLLCDQAVAGVQGTTVAAPGPVGRRSIAVTRPSRLYHTCNIAYRADVVLRVGGFDPDFRGWFEDTSLGARVERLGTIAFQPAARVVHLPRPRAAMSAELWRVLIEDERRLAAMEPGFYRQVRGPSVGLSLVARWLIGSPLKSLIAELAHAPTEPRGYLRHARDLVAGRIILLQIILDGSVGRRQRLAPSQPAETDAGRGREP